MEIFNPFLDAVAALPAFLEGVDRLALIAATFVATAVAVGTVARNHEFGSVAKILVAALIFAAVFAAGLAVAHYAPAWIDTARMARGLDRP